MIGTILLSCGLGRYFKHRSQIHQKEQLQVFLEYLGGRLAAGQTLEHALVHAAQVLELQLGTTGTLHQSLLRLQSNLEAHLSLQECFNRFNQDFTDSTARRFFQILPHLRLAGGQIDRYIRNCHRMLSEQLLQQKESEAEQSQKQSEAFILLFLPFLFAFLLNNTIYQYARTISLVTWGSWAMFFVYLLAMSAACLILFILAPSANMPSHSGRSGKTSKQENHKPQGTLSRKGGPLFTRLYSCRISGSYGFHLLRILQETNHSESVGKLETFMIKKSWYTLTGILLGAMAVCAQALPPAALVIFPVVLNVLQDQQVFKEDRNRRQSYRAEWPALINQISVMLNSGLTLQKCLDLVFLSDRATGWEKQNSPLRQDLVLLQQTMRSGQSAASALQKIMLSCPLPEIQAALQLMIRYEQDGSPELLDLLQMQASGSWQLYRHALHKRLERKALLLLIPMSMDLVAVMLIALLPALATLQSG